MSQSDFTIEDFVQSRPDMPDGGRWCELHAGAVVSLEPPEEGHGNVVLNFSKAFADHLGRSEELPAYGCFELGLAVARNPDTLCAPAASLFAGGPRFAEADKPYTENVPNTVVEIAAGRVRRTALKWKTPAYLAWGVERVWMVDPEAKAVHVVDRSGTAATLADAQILESGEDLADFRIQVSALFAAPAWW